MSDAADRPHFDRPPVHQVVIGVVFEPLLQLRASHVGLLWSDINRGDKYPIVEEFDSIRSYVEDFHDGEEESLDDVEFSVAGADAGRRVVLSSADLSQQISIQRDLLQISWRRVDGATYPRFEAPMELFGEVYSQFQKFLDSRKIGRLRPRQAEVSYLNVIPLHRQEVQAQAESLVNFKLITGDNVPPSDHFHTFQRHTLKTNGEPWGRLYVAFDSEGYRRVSTDIGGDFSEGQLSFSVQGLAKDREEVFDVIERGHRTIVDSFAATITSFGEMFWGRTQVEGGDR